MDKFLNTGDELGKLIDSAALDLYERLQKVEADTLHMPPHCLDYYNRSHFKRLFFSIETSAHLLYRSIKLCGLHPSKITVMDYGAGVGTLFLLAKLVGCKRVIYNDHLEDWQLSAKLIADAINVSIDEYIIGDIYHSLEQLDKLNITLNIVTSRNVVEHIYRLDEFYRAIYERQPSAIIFSSTTANSQNPASVLKHVLWHRKWENVFRKIREARIKSAIPELAKGKIRMLASSTRGLAAEDLDHAIKLYKQSGTVPNPSDHGTNTCDPSNGVWAEHLLGRSNYKNLINEERFTVSFAAGFWDTHYKSSLMNLITGFLNKIISFAGISGMKLAPFIYVIAVPIKKKLK